MAKYVMQEMRNLHCDKDIFLLKAHSYYYLSIL